MKSSSILSRFSLIAALSAFAFILSACGQRGDLIHPDKDKEMGQPRTSANQKNGSASDTSNVPSQPTNGLPVPVTP